MFIKAPRIRKASAASPSCGANPRSSKKGTEASCVPAMAPTVPRRPATAGASRVAPRRVRVEAPLIQPYTAGLAPSCCTK